MTQPLIKICGIKHPTLIADLHLLGIDFIGIVCHPASKRYVDIETARTIALTAIKHHLLPVAVFVNQTAAEIEHICNYTHINIIQLHGERCKQQHPLLSTNYRRIYVQNVDQDGTVMPDTAAGLRYCDPQRDFLMFDNHCAGSGKKFDWKNFSYKHPFKWFLAGGLTPANVAQAINILHPDAVDISSGVENESGEKDIDLIAKFVDSSKGYKPSRNCCSSILKR